MATYIPAGIPIPYEGLENGSIINDDGHGWAVASSDGIEVGKSMDFTEAVLGLAEAREKHGRGALALFHSRFATHGVKDEFNVHPFHVTPETVVAHNGILPMHWLPDKKDQRSDTRILCDKTMPHFLSPSGVPSRRGAKTLGKMIGSFNKLIVLTAANGEPRARIINAHMGTHADGVWYSNDGYLPSRYNWRTWNQWTDEDEKRWQASDSTTFWRGQEFSDEQCEVCFSRGSIAFDTGWCDHCHWCSTCYSVQELCSCSWNQRLALEAGEPADGDEEYEAANRAANALLDESDLDFGPVIG
jgi:glutamine amidotransferase